MSRGPSGSDVLWSWDPADGLAVAGIWRHLQNAETTTSNQLVSNWPNGTATRTTLPSVTKWDGSTGQVVKFEIRSGDVGGGAGCRSELSGAFQSWTLKEGDERWFQYRVMFPADFNVDDDAGFFIITQFHAGSNAQLASPPVTISFDDSRNLRIGGTTTTPSESKILLTKAEFDARRGEWMDFNLHIVSSIDPAVGGIQFHIDGVEVVPFFHRQTMNSAESYVKIGAYRNSGFTTTDVLYFDDVVMSTGVETGGSAPGGGGTGTITVVGSAGADNDGLTSSVACPVPAGTAAGDLLVASVTSGQTVGVPSQGDWLEFTGASALTGSVANKVFYRWATASEPASYTFTIGATDDLSAGMVALRGADATTPLDATVATATFASSTSHAVPGVTTATDNALALFISSVQSGTQTITAPGSVTAIYNGSANAARAQHFGYEVVPTAGATGTRTYTISSGVPGVGVAVAIRPAAGASATTPTVDAGADASVQVGSSFTRTAGENDGGATITSRLWEIVSAPAEYTGSTVLASTVDLSWSPTVDGSYVLRYTATNSAGSGTDDVAVTVLPAGTIEDVVVVQTNDACTVFNETSQPVSDLLLPLASPATAGNTLVACWTVNNSAGVLTPPVGWSVFGATSAGAVSQLVAGKIASGGETGATATWSDPEAQASGVIYELGGTHETNPFGPSQHPSYVDVAGTSITLDPAAAVAQGAALAFVSVAGVGNPGEFSPASSGWTLDEATVPPDGNVLSAGTAGLHLPSVAKGADLTSTFSWTTSQKNLGTILLLNAKGTDVTAPADPPGTRPALNDRIVGFPEPGQAFVKINTGAVRARLRVGTDPDVSTNVRYGPYGTPNSRGDVTLTVGLPLTYGVGRYYYRVSMVNAEGGEWLDDKGTVGELLGAPTGRVGLKLAAGACNKNSHDINAASAIVAQGVDLFCGLGDWYYNDAAGDTAANMRTEFDNKARATQLSDMLATTPSILTPDDHDALGNDGTYSSQPAAWDDYNLVYREKWPHPALEQSTRGLYWTRPWGTNIRIIVLDTRSYATKGSTVLGSTQKAWLFNILDTMTEDIAVIVQGAVWNHSIQDSAEDGWEGALTERNEVGNYIEASGKQVIMLAGDMHALARVSPAGNLAGNFPVYQCGPLANTSSHKGTGYAQGPIPSSTGTWSYQYGLVDITLGETTLSSRFTGLSSSNTVRLGPVTDTFTATAPPVDQGRLLQVWDGSQLVVRSEAVWDGTSLVNRVTEVWDGVE